MVKNKRVAAIIALALLALIGMQLYTQLDVIVPSSEGFESSTIPTGWTSDGEVSTSTDVAYQGSRSLKCTLVYDGLWQVSVGTTEIEPTFDLATRFYIYIPSAPSDATASVNHLQVINILQTVTLWRRVCFVMLDYYPTTESWNLVLTVDEAAGGISDQSAAISLDYGIWHYLEVVADVEGGIYNAYWDSASPLISMSGFTYNTTALPIGITSVYTGPLSSQMGVTTYIDTWAVSHSLIGPVGPVGPSDYTLTISAGANGVTDPLPDTYTYSSGTEVSITATPNEGYYFSHWSIDDVVSSTNPTSVTMDQDHTVEAYFSATQTTLQNYTLTINVAEHGTTDPLPESYRYTEGSIVSITAVPDEGYGLTHWVLDGENKTVPSLEITVSANHNVSVYFALLGGETPIIPTEPTGIQGWEIPVAIMLVVATVVGVVVMRKRSP